MGTATVGSPLTPWPRPWAKIHGHGRARCHVCMEAWRIQDREVPVAASLRHLLLMLLCLACIASLPRERVQRRPCFRCAPRSGECACVASPRERAFALALAVP